MTTPTDDTQFEGTPRVGAAVELDPANPVLVHMIPQAHIDLAWQWSADDAVEMVLDTFRAHVSLLEEDPSRTYAQSQLAAYYEHTDALLLPTLLESYSGTYNEAMRFHRPVLTSDLDFAHAVCGDAAVYFDPWNPADIASAIVRLKNDADLRRRLVAAGDQQKERASKSWDEIAASVMNELAALTKS